MKYCLTLLVALINLYICPTAFAETACPNSFPQFLDQFGNDRAFQEAQTKYPVTYISNNGTGDNCYPDCKLVTGKLSRRKAKALSEPIFPLSSTQALHSLEKKIAPSKDHILVRVDKPDSDSFSFEYIFERNGPCWQLILAKDMSI